MTRYLVPPAGTALLLIDVINDLEFQGSERLVAQAEPMARGSPRSSAAPRRGHPGDLRQRQLRPVAVGLPPDGGALHRTSSPGRRVSRRLRPTAQDYFVLKPKHSGFFDTTLDTLLETCASGG